MTYNVVAPADLAILKIAPLLVRAGSTITYTIGVGNLGGSNAVDVVVSDTLPANTTLVSASGKNVSCAVVNGKLTCSTTPMTWTGGSTVSCSAAAIAPLSWSSLYGATLKITVSWAAMDRGRSRIPLRCSASTVPKPSKVVERRDVGDALRVAVSEGLQLGAPEDPALPDFLVISLCRPAHRQWRPRRLP